MKHTLTPVQLESVKKSDAILEACKKELDMLLAKYNAIRDAHGMMLKVILDAHGISEKECINFNPETGEIDVLPPVQEEVKSDAVPEVPGDA